MCGGVAEYGHSHGGKPVQICPHLPRPRAVRSPLPPAEHSYIGGQEKPSSYVVRQEDKEIMILFFPNYHFLRYSLLIDSVPLASLKQFPHCFIGKHSGLVQYSQTVLYVVFTVNC